VAAKTRVLSLLVLVIVIVVAGCGGGGGSNVTPVVSVRVSPSSPQSIDQGQQVPITASVSNDSTAAGVTWSLTGTGALSGSSTTAVTYTAPTSGAAGSATVTATSVTDPTKNAALTINFSLLPSFTTTTLPPGVEGTNYNQNLSVTGGAGTLTYSLASGTLPAGLHLSNAGAITGTPTGPNGTTNFTAKATDSSDAGPQSATQPLSITVNLPPSPAITPATLPPATEFTAYTAAIQATGYVPLSYSVTTGTLPAGLALNNTTGAITGTPQGPAGTSNFTVTVTDGSNPAQSVSQPFSITVNLPPPPAITPATLPSATEFTAYTATIQATGYAPLSYSVTTGSLPAGLTLNSATGAITGPPQGPPGTSNFTVTVTDSSNPAQSVSQPFSITVNVAAACGTGSESLFNGQYALLLQGFDASGPTAMLGSFTTDGAGAITAGTEDINSTGLSGVQTNLNIDTGNSSYSIAADHSGCLTLTAGGVTRSYRFVADLITSGVAGGARIIEFDSTGALTSGVLRIQTPSAFSNAQVTGNYAFGIGGAKTGGTGALFQAAGVFTLSGTSVTGFVDSNDAGSMNQGSAGYPAQPLSLTGGTYNISSNGRGTLTFIPGTGLPVSTVMYVLYNNEFFLMTTDLQSINPLSSGTALLQTGTPYGQSSLGAVSVMYTIGSAGTSTKSRVEAGLFTPDGGGHFTFSGDQNSGGTLSTFSNSGSYTTDVTTGRVLFSNAGSSTPDTLMYLVSPNTGFVLSTDNHVMSGFAEAQTGSPFTNASLTGDLSTGTLVPVSTGSTLSVGSASFDGAGNLNGADNSNAEGILSLDNSFSLTYAVSASGRTVLPATGTPQRLIYIISPTKSAAFDFNATTTNPILQVIEQ
jgi:Putative Ig domain